MAKPLTDAALALAEELAILSLVTSHAALATAFSGFGVFNDVETTSERLLGGIDLVDGFLLH